ncbi:MAG: Gfo/Idh/MocA family oxidoreductase [Chloroflexi bacterium]|nr:Gfo/Idh/MocA family oxidoreductase [Chloroflexota bacterium]
MTRRFIQVGVGGYGRTWLDTMVRERSRAAYAALVDPDARAMEVARSVTGVPAERCFASLEEAIAATSADALLCVVPPAAHEEVITRAFAAGLDVLSEKPIADTMAASRRIVERAARTGRTLMISQKGRFHPWVRRFRQAIASREAGPLSHLTLHYRAPLFQWGASGFRHRMDDPLLVEMSIHHFDLLRALLGGDPIDVAGTSWNTPESGFRGDVAASLVFRFAGNVPVVYEGYCRSSGDLTSWYGDIRAECDRGAIVMVYPHLYLARRGADQTLVTAPRDHLEKVGDLQLGQAEVLTEFLDALDEGRAPESSGAENLISVAMVFAAADACRTGERRQIADYLS